MERLAIAKYCLFLSLLLCHAYGQNTLNIKDDGFRGIWYSIGKTNNEYVYKYSGGLGTYPANHYPFSVYSETANKTFFCYGGASKDSIPSLLHEVAYFDHKTGAISKPIIVLDKKTNDAHDNPVISIDDSGFIWLFSTSHGVERPSYIHVSTKPYDISEFAKVEARFMKNGENVPLNNFSYLQIYYVKNQGFLGLMTHYEKDVLKYGKNKPRRTIGCITSKNGIEWSEIKDLGIMEEGHYQSSGIALDKKGNTKIASVFNFHPNTEIGAGLDYRTNLYYLETKDFGKTWQNAQGQNVELPLQSPQNTALVKDYQSEGKLVYINDMAFDKNQNPLISYITSHSPEPGPQNKPYLAETAFWNGHNWTFSKTTETDHNYDMGSVFIENKKWRILIPAFSGPQTYNTGGELEFWQSKDLGKTWKKNAQITKNSPYNHSYPRKTLNGHPDFYAFWADGDARKPSESSLYFANKKGTVFRLPRHMNADVMLPEKINYVSFKGSDL